MSMAKERLAEHEDTNTQSCSKSQVRNLSRHQSNERLAENEDTNTHKDQEIFSAVSMEFRLFFVFIAFQKDLE